MANFRTHLSVATVAGVLVGLGGRQMSLWPTLEAVPITVLIAFGGILPDIDSDNSHAVRLVFTLLAALATVSGALMFQEQLAPGMLLMLCAVLFLGIRYVLSAVFKHFSVHRGIWHSLLATLLGSLLTACASYQFFLESAWMAWAHGLALGFGMMVHLLLDECYSVDLVGIRVKRSFGTALKFFDYREPLNSLLMLLLMSALIPWLPPWSALTQLVSQGMGYWF
ncbi:metal-dependent hydrolase [Halomonas sp. PR-M31]|uniref:metal-dependent hydrolase n=1 Tax=Halomonas sp. PR-M31 TaxID=1471202 RepID=UPI000650C2D7|nr:metal-dependent hydrolase [Halomonas sp. PR-M31]